MHSMIALAMVKFADYSMHVLEDEHATAACQLQGGVLQALAHPIRIRIWTVSGW